MNNIILCLTDSDFENKVLKTDNIKDNKLFLIDFWAEWCNPCKIIAPIIEEIAIKFKSKLQVAKLNIDNNPITIKKYGIKSIPTLLLIRNNLVLSTKVGLLSKQQLEEFIQTYL